MKNTRDSRPAVYPILSASPGVSPGVSACFNYRTTAQAARSTLMEQRELQNAV